jgi:hypothetical protein
LGTHDINEIDNILIDNMLDSFFGYCGSRNNWTVLLYFAGRPQSARYAKTPPWRELARFFAVFETTVFLRESVDIAIYSCLNTHLMRNRDVLEGRASIC